MTHITIPRFLKRGLLIGSAFAALAIPLSASGALAATSGQPYPTPSPTVVQVHHQKPVTRCFLSLETEHDTLTGLPVERDNHGATIEVVQLVKVCVTTERHHPDVVKVWDETGPFAWEIPADGFAPTPHGLPTSIAPLYTQPVS